MHVRQVLYSPRRASLASPIPLRAPNILQSIKECLNMQTDLCVSSVPLVQSSRTEWTTELDGAGEGCYLMSSVISRVQSFARKLPSEFQ